MLTSKRDDLRPVAIFLTPVWPTPGGSGRALRAWDWLNELSASHRVHVLIDGESTLPHARSGRAEGWWPVPALPSGQSRWLRALALIVPPICLFDRRLAADWVDWDLNPTLNRLGAALAGHRVTRIVVFRVYLHDAGRAIARNFPEAEIELDMDDLESRTRLSVAGSLLRMGRPKMALRTFLGALQYAGLERWVLGSYRKIWLATMEDGKGLARRWASVVSERPNRIVPPRSVAHPPNGLVRLLFVGTLNYAPNEEAVRMIMLSIVPQLRRRLSVPWRLCIVGRHASAKLVALLSQSPEVEFIPDAEDVTPWYELSHMVLVPLHAGGGTKLKTIEAFAHRRAVISTPQGMRGLHAIAHEHYLPARTPDQFVDAILSLATDSLELQRIASGGWALFSQQRKGV